MITYSKNSTPRIHMKVGIIGLGQIGASIASGLSGKVKQTMGFDTREQNTKYCIDTGILDKVASIDEIAHYTNLVIIATPVDSIAAILHNLLDKQNTNLIVTDVGSTKYAICHSVHNHPSRNRYVASHPMAGNSGTGPQSATANLFVKKDVFICDSEASEPAALGLVQSLWEELGANVHQIDSQKHDEIVSTVSHIPQIASLALAQLVAIKNFNEIDWLNAASSGFNSMTRLAGNSAEVWIPILNHNKQNIINNLRLLQQILSHMEQAIEDQQNDTLAELIRSANKIRKKFENKLILPKSHETHQIK